MDQKKTWAQNNQSLVEILGYFMIIVIMLISILALILYGFHLSGLNDPIVDQASGKEIDPKNYGSVNNWKLSVIGFEEIRQYYPQDAHSKIVQTIQNYFSATHPKGKRISYKKDSYKENNFKVMVNDTHTYDINAVVDSDNAIKLEIKEGDSTILNYTITNLATINLPANAIDDFLPYVGKTEEDEKYTVLRRSKDKKLEISVDNCGNEEIRTRVQKNVDEWLKSHNFKPEDFKFEIPKYCDAKLNI